jgi:hypothetical protein
MAYSINKHIYEASKVGCAAIFGSKRMYAKIKRIFIRFEANKTGCIRLFRIEANQRILHEKRIKTEAIFV